LANAKGRLYLGAGLARGCFSSMLDEVTFGLPYVLFGKKEITLEGNVSMTFDINNFIPSYAAISGGWNQESKIGFKYDPDNRDGDDRGLWGYIPILSAFSTNYKGECSDKPMNNFLMDVLFTGGLFKDLVDSKFACDVRHDDDPFLMLFGFGAGFIGAGWEEIVGLWEMFKNIPQIPSMVLGIVNDPIGSAVNMVKDVGEYLGKEYGPPYCPGRISYICGKVVFYIVEAIAGAAALKALSKISAVKNVIEKVNTVKNTISSRALKTAGKLSAAFGKLKYAAKYGFDTYDNLFKRVDKALNIKVHHLYEKRFAKTFGVKEGKMKSLAVTQAEHDVFTSAWRKAIPYKNSKNPINTLTATQAQIKNAARRIYAEYPEILKALSID